MPLATFDLLACIITARAGDLGCLDALAVQAAGGRMLVTACLLAYRGSQGVVNTLPIPAVTPLPKVMIYTFPFGKIFWPHSPFDPPDSHIKDGVDDGSHIELARPSARFSNRNQIFDKIPLIVGQIS